jgi:hypothetical protein
MNSRQSAEKGIRNGAREAWQQWALELAQDKRLTGTPRQVGTNQYQARLYLVPSRTTDGSYLVTVWKDDKLTCTCLAGAYGRPCGHVGAVLTAEMQRQAAECSCVDEPLRAWLTGGEW